VLCAEEYGDSPLNADVPAVFVGGRFPKKLPMKLVHSMAAAMFAVMGVLARLKIDTWIK
jgi:putative Ca2+/H+ antiporter (TMEM165/GDT1 family)